MVFTEQSILSGIRFSSSRQKSNFHAALYAFVDVPHLRLLCQRFVGCQMLREKSPGLSPPGCFFPSLQQRRVGVAGNQFVMGLVVLKPNLRILPGNTFAWYAMVRRPPVPPGRVPSRGGLLLAL